MPDVEGHLAPASPRSAGKDYPNSQPLTSQLLDQAYRLRGTVLLIISVVAFVLLSYVVLTTSFSGEDPGLGPSPTGEEVSVIVGDAQG